MKFFESYSEQFKYVDNDKGLLSMYKDAPKDTLVANALVVGIFIASFVVLGIVSAIEPLANSNVAIFIVLGLIIVCAIFSTKAGVEQPITARGIIATEIKKRHPEYKLGNNKYLYVRKCVELNGLDKSYYEVNKTISVVNTILFVISYLINIAVRGVLAAIIVAGVGICVLLMSVYVLIWPGATEVQRWRDKLFKIVVWAVKFFIGSFKIEIHDMYKINYDYPKTEEQIQHEKAVEKDKYVSVCDYVRYKDLSEICFGGDTHWTIGPNINNLGTTCIISGTVKLSSNVTRYAGDMYMETKNVQAKIKEVVDKQLENLYKDHPYATKMNVQVDVNVEGEVTG